MKLVLFRHAEKVGDWSDDPSLSEKGIKQAHRLISKVEGGEIPQPKVLFVSPKKRTRETFLPLADHFQLSVTSLQMLNERQDGEDFPALHERVQEFISHCQDSSEETIYACTHLDWIDAFAELVPFQGDRLPVSSFTWYPASSLVFEIGPSWKLLAMSSSK